MTDHDQHHQPDDRHDGPGHRFDVAVVGAGLAGLSAAIEVAIAGRSVVLLDARRTIGGRARTHERDGYLLNEGAHALYVDGAAMRFLTDLDCPPPGAAPNAAAGIGVDGEVAGRFPTTAIALLRTRLLRGDRLTMARLFARLPKLDPSDFADRTVDDAVAELLGSGRAARLGHALFRLSTYANDPSTTSADAGITQLQMSIAGGVRYLDGGWQTMIDDLARVARERGVDLRSNSKVESVERTTHDEHLVRTSAGDVTANRVVVAASPDLAAKLFGDDAPICREWAEAARPSVVASLDVGIPDDGSAHVPFALGIDTPTYLSLHAPVAHLAPKGHSLIHVMRYLPGTEPTDSDCDRAECEALLDRVRPDWRRAANHISFRPHLVAAFDQPTADAGGLAGRPAVCVPGTDDRWFVAGDWVGTTGMLADASVTSGRAAGRSAARAAAGSRERTPA